jgi:hypothetical protein
MTFSGATDSPAMMMAFDSTGNLNLRLVGISAKGKGKHTDGQVWSPFCPKRVAFDVSIVNPTAFSHSGAGACGDSESFHNPNALRDHWQPEICREDEN